MINNSTIPASDHQPSFLTYQIASGFLADSYLLMGLLVVLSAAYITDTAYTLSKLPPGPWGYPVLGVLPLLRHKPHLVVQKWWLKYGDLCCMRMGQRRVVILNSVEAMKQCFVNNADLFSARPNNFFKKMARNKG